MRAVIQRVSTARVLIDGNEHSRIGKGLVVLLGVERDDTADDVGVMAQKTVELRVFGDADGKMNRSVLDTGGEVLAVSQFTLLGDCRKGRRPSFDRAARPEEARDLYEQYVREVQNAGVRVSTGVFQAMMDVELTNDGPVTLMLDSRKRF